MVRFFFLMIRRPPRTTTTATLFPSTTLFRSTRIPAAFTTVFSWSAAHAGKPLILMMTHCLRQSAQSPGTLASFPSVPSWKCLAAARHAPETGHHSYRLDRKSVVKGKSVSVRVDLGGGVIITKNKKQKKRIKNT